MKIPYFLYLTCSIGYKQIKFTLPRIFWDRISIVENNEIMVDYYGFKMRKLVAEKLDQVKNSLPSGISLKVLDGYRSLERQQEAWSRKWDMVKLENPNWLDEQIDQEVGLVVARPKGITNHVCGGAVDVCLVNKDGEMLDFGTGYAPADEQGRKKCPMFALGLTQTQKDNRKLLRKAMESAGFVWYPGEWWHYCYGDRMWAVYTGRTECVYGPVKSND